MNLNFFPLKFDFEKYQINIEPYTDNRLSELRKKHNSTHSFFRNGDFIYVSNKEDETNAQIGTLTERNIFEDAEISASLIKHLFFRTFKDRFSNYTPVDFYPFRFFSAKTKDDIIFNYLPEKLQNIIGYKKLIELQLRQSNSNGVKQFGFLINVKRNWIFNKSCEELHSEKFDLIGVDVLHAEVLPGLTNILAPNEEFIGVIKEINDGEALVETNAGLISFHLGELFITKTKLNIRNYLTFATSQEKSDEILNVIETKRQDIYNVRNLLSEIKSIAKGLFLEGDQPVVFQNKDGFCFTVDSIPKTFTNSIDLKTPTFIFDSASTKTINTYPDKGLSNYGPYDSIFFDIKSPRVLCICNRANRGTFSNFLSNLKDGLPHSTYFQKGLQKKYDLKEINYDINEIASYNVADYLNIIKGYDEKKPDLAIIEIPSSFRKIKDSENPYFIIKAKLLSLEIPVQYVTSERINSPNEYVLNSISLQIYAKLGGTPWVLPSQKSVDKEIIVGIGHSWLRKNQYKGAEQNRVVGITTFLSSDGQYLLGDKVKDVPYESYFEELLKSLKQSISRLSAEQGWVKDDTVRLIFHIFKPIKNVEFDVISQLIKEIQDYKIKFAFVTISKTHPIVLFDTNQVGVKKNSNSPIKGECIPVRGSNIFLDSETAIVQMYGANELKTSKQGMSSPIQIKIRTPQGKHSNHELNDLLFYDLSYITQQIYSFTNLSWRSFLPSDQPATMLYSDLISNMLSKMRNVPGWDADKLNYGLKRKKWFL